MDFLASVLLFCEMFNINTKPTSTIDLTTSIKQYETKKEANLVSENSENNTTNKIIIGAKKLILANNLEEQKIEETIKNNEYNKDYINYLGEQKGIEVKKLLELSKVKYLDYIKNNNKKIEIQFKDLISKENYDQEEYLRYLDKSISEVDLFENYIVGMEYNEDLTIRKIIILEKDKIR